MNDAAGKGFLATAGYVELALGTRIWTKATDLRSKRGQASRHTTSFLQSSDAWAEQGKRGS